MGILIIPFNNISKDLLVYLKKELAKKFDTEVMIYKQVKTPICMKKGEQLDARAFIPEITNLVLKKKHYYGLGIIKKDLYVLGLNFVFGLASNYACIISLAKLKSHNKELYFKRTLKEAVHELGHLHGLNHCMNSRCVMYFSNCLEDTDNKKEDFCEGCRKDLKG